MLGFDPIASTPLAALPTVQTTADVTGLEATSGLGGNEVVVIWSSVVIPVNVWTPVNIFYPS
jgi:hypothetical protein